MISLAGMRWASFGSPVMPEYEVTRSLMGSQGAALLWGFSDPSRSWGSLGEFCERSSATGWLANTELNGKVLEIPKDRLGSSSQDLVWVTARFLTFNRNQARAVTGLLTGHNTLRRHLHLLGLLDSPLCRKCGKKEETSAHILCECEALASFRHRYLDAFFLEPEDIRNISLGAIWNLSKAIGLPWFW